MKRIRELRKSRGWSQEQAAEKCGIDYKLYQFYELGIRDNPGLLNVEQIAKGYGLTISELLSPTAMAKKSPPKTKARSKSRP